MPSSPASSVCDQHPCDPLPMPLLQDESPLAEAEPEAEVEAEVEAASHPHQKPPSLELKPQDQGENDSNQGSSEALESPSLIRLSRLIGREFRQVEDAETGVPIFAASEKNARLREDVLERLDVILGRREQRQPLLKQTGPYRHPIFRQTFNNPGRYIYLLYTGYDQIDLPTMKHMSPPDGGPYNPHLLRLDRSLYDFSAARARVVPAVVTLIGLLEVLDLEPPPEYGEDETDGRQEFSDTFYTVAVNTEASSPERGSVWILSNNSDRRALSTDHKKFMYWLKKHDKWDPPVRGKLRCKEWEEDGEVDGHWDEEKIMGRCPCPDGLFGGELCVGPIGREHSDQLDDNMNEDVCGSAIGTWDPVYADETRWPHQPGPYYDAACIMTSYLQLGQADLAEARDLIRESRCVIDPRVEKVRLSDDRRGFPEDSTCQEKTGEQECAREGTQPRSPS